MQPNRRPKSPRSLAFACLLALLLAPSACQIHTHRVGGGPTGIGQESERQFYLFFGLLRVNDVNVQRYAADLTSYEIRSEFSWVDLLLAPLLLPFTVTTRTVTVSK